MLLVILLAACGGPRPYVQHVGEFNRNDPNFGKEIRDRNSVEICYNKLSTTPEIVRQMASVECAKFGKRAQFKTQDHLECPLFTPARALFLCHKP